MLLKQLDTFLEKNKAGFHPQNLHQKQCQMTQILKYKKENHEGTIKKWKNFISLFWGRPFYFRHKMRKP